MSREIDIRCAECGHEWTAPRDPALQVPCPDCSARVGAKCRKPSGHTAPHGWVHARRDVAALEAGAYGTHRQEGRCRVSHEAAVARARRRVGLPPIEPAADDGLSVVSLLG